MDDFTSDGTQHGGVWQVDPRDGGHYWVPGSDGAAPDALPHYGQAYRELDKRTGHYITKRLTDDPEYSYSPSDQLQQDRTVWAELIKELQQDLLEAGHGQLETGDPEAAGLDKIKDPSRFAEEYFKRLQAKNARIARETVEAEPWVQDRMRQLTAQLERYSAMPDYVADKGKLVRQTREELAELIKKVQA